jgi:pilus assembly protein CpaB
MLGIAAAVLAAVVLLVYLNQYRKSVGAGSQPVSVLVAKRLIETGTPGDTVALKQFFEIASTPKDYVKPTALTDPAALRGTVAARDIVPGQQLTAADFAPSYTVVGTTLVDNQRAMAVPIDAARGLTGRLQAGDRLDIYGNFDLDGRAVTKLIMQDIYVLEPTVGASGGIAGGGSSNILLRVTSSQAARLAFATKNGELWMVVRPRVNAKRVKPELVTLNGVLGG